MADSIDVLNTEDSRIVFNVSDAPQILDEYMVYFNSFKALMPKASENPGFMALSNAGFDTLACREFDESVEEIVSTVGSMESMARLYFDKTNILFDEEKEEMPEVDMPLDNIDGIEPNGEEGAVPADYDIPQDGNRAGGFGIDGINTNGNLPSGGGNVVSEVTKEAINELLNYVGEKQANEALDSEVLKERLESMNKPGEIKVHDIDEEMKYSDEESKISDDFINPRKAVPGTGPMPNEGTTYDDDLSLRYSEEFTNSMGAKSRGPVAGTEPTPVKRRGTTYDGDQSLKHSEEFAESMGAKSRGPVAGTEPTPVKRRGTTYDGDQSLKYSEEFAESMGERSRGPVAGTEPTPVKRRGTTYDGDQSLRYSEEFAESMGAKSRGPVAGTEPTPVKGIGTTYDSGKGFGYSEGPVPNKGTTYDGDQSLKYSEEFINSMINEPEYSAHPQGSSSNGPIGGRYDSVFDMNENPFKVNN